MATLSLELTRDEVSPALARLAGLQFHPRTLLAAGGVATAHGQRAFDKPVRSAPWVRRMSGSTHPLLLQWGTLRTNIHAQLAGSDSVKIGAAPVFPVEHDQITRVVSNQVGKSIERALAGA